MGMTGRRLRAIGPFKGVVGRGWAVLCPRHYARHPGTLARLAGDLRGRKSNLSRHNRSADLTQEPKPAT